MKAGVFGATGLVGSELLNACIATDKITKVYVVTRRALDDDRAKNPKVEVILHSDFTQYPPALLNKLRGIELCLWYASESSHPAPLSALRLTRCTDAGLFLTSFPGQSAVCCPSLIMTRNSPTLPMSSLPARPPPPLSSISPETRPRARFASSFAAASIPRRTRTSRSGS